MRRLAESTEPILARMREFAVSYNVNIIAGSMPVIERKRLYNVAYLCRRDGSFDSVKKIHVTPSEREAFGMSGGDVIRALDTDCGKIGILICYDVEFPELPRLLRDQGAEILFVPYMTDLQTGYQRVRFCAHARAVENECYVAIAGSVGNLPRVDNMDIQYSQSAIFSPSDFSFPSTGIMAESTPNTEMVLIADVDLDLLKHLSDKGSVNNLRDRRTRSLLPEAEEEGGAALAAGADGGCARGGAGTQPSSDRRRAGPGRGPGAPPRPFGAWAGCATTGCCCGAPSIPRPRRRAPPASSPAPWPPCSGTPPSPLSGDAPWGMHLLMILAWLALVLGALRWHRRFGGTTAGAAVVALALALHGALVEPRLWAAAGNGVLAAALGVWGAWRLADGPGRAGRALGLLLLAAAVLARADAVLLLVLPIVARGHSARALDLAAGRPGRGRGHRPGHDGGRGRRLDLPPRRRRSPAAPAGGALGPAAAGGGDGGCRACSGRCWAWPAAGC